MSLSAHHAGDGPQMWSGGAEFALKFICTNFQGQRQLSTPLQWKSDYFILTLYTLVKLNHGDLINQKEIIVDGTVYQFYQVDICEV